MPEGSFRAGTIAACIVLAAGVAPGVEAAGTSPAKKPPVLHWLCGKVEHPEVKAEWGPSSESMGGLMRSKDYEVRAAYRMKGCKTGEMTVYVLEGLSDRSVLYECTIDDTYRPISNCYKLGNPPENIQ